MKKTNIFKARLVPLFGIIALAAIIGFGLAACGEDPGGDPGNPFAGTTWEGDVEDMGKITVTFTATTWQTEAGGSVVSSGAYTYSGNTATLTISNVPELEGKTATATISGNSLQVDAEDFDMGSFTLTKKTGPGPVPDEGLTISGIPTEYNGNWVIGMGMLGDEEDGIQLFAAGEFNGTTFIGKGAQISGGSVSLNVWEVVNGDPMEVSEFTGSDRVGFDVYIINTEAFNAANNEELGNLIVGSGSVTVTFTDGKGSGVFSANDGYTITINGMDSFNGEPAFVCLHHDIRNIDWNEDDHYGERGTVVDGSLTVTIGDWDGSGSYQIAVFFWEDQGASMTATYYYTNGAELADAAPLPAYNFDADDGNTVLNFSKFRNADGSGGGPDPATGLTITGFDSEYNGNWVIGMGMLGDEEDGIQLLATGEFSGTTLIGKGAQISGGSVNLNVFEVDTDTMAVSPFTGNGEADFEVFIINTETFDAGENPEFEGIFVGHGSVTVTFTNGTGSGKISEIDDDNGEGGGDGGTSGNPPTSENVQGTWKIEVDTDTWSSFQFSGTSLTWRSVAADPPANSVYEGTFTIDGDTINVALARMSNDGGVNWTPIPGGSMSFYNVSISDDGSTMTVTSNQDPDAGTTTIYTKQ